MRKFIVLVAALAMSMSMLGTAMADNSAFDTANNADNCEAADGEFATSRDGKVTTNTCTVAGAAGSSEWVAASHPQQAWTVQITTPGATEVYTRVSGGGRVELSYEETGGGDPVITGCRNNQGNDVEDFETNANCTPAA